MAKQKTKRDFFNEIKEVLIERGATELIEFVDHELDLLNRKSGNAKPTKTQEENEVFKNIIVQTLETIGKRATITEIQEVSEVLADLSNQKISALLTQLVNAKIVARVPDKKKTYFELI